MAEDKNWEDYLYAKINFFICVELYNRLKEGNRLHDRFVDNYREEEYKETKKNTQSSHYRFEDAMNIKNKKWDRIYRAKGNNKVSKVESTQIADMFGISTDYFLPNKKMLIEIPDMTLDKWKAYFKMIYCNELSVGRTYDTKEFDKEKMMEDLIEQLEEGNKKCSDAIIQIYNYYRNGKKLENNITQTRVASLMNSLRELNNEDWKIVYSNIDEYIEIIEKQVNLARAVKTVMTDENKKI